MGYGSINALCLGNLPILHSIDKAGFQTTKLLGSKCGKCLTQLSQQKLPVLVCFSLKQDLLCRTDLLRKVILYFRGFIQGVSVYPQISPGIIIDPVFLPYGICNLIRYLYEKMSSS